jgi:putative addiction module component (TIGR02574 family)
MNSTSDQLLNAALALPAGERLEFAEALVASLRPEDRPPFDEAWREVIRRRAAEITSGQVTSIPWSDVKRQAREKTRKKLRELESLHCNESSEPSDDEELFEASRQSVQRLINQLKEEIARYDSHQPTPGATETTVRER